jgi:hypothetical protein
MAKQNTSLKALDDLLATIETDVKRARLLLAQLQWAAESGDTTTTFDFEWASEKLMSYATDESITVVEGVFDGYFMVGSDKKKYPVPLNYSSKTKLIPGDVLKLRIMEDGKLVYKLISQANRKYIKATLSKSDENKYTALSDEGQIYFLNQAAITYFKGKTGDELSIIVNADGVGNFAAIEALIPRITNM